jgi:hypothetical protein
MVDMTVTYRFPAHVGGDPGAGDQRGDGRDVHPGADPRRTSPGGEQGRGSRRESPAPHRDRRPDDGFDGPRSGTHPRWTGPHGPGQREGEQGGPVEPLDRQAAESGPHQNRRDDSSAVGAVDASERNPVDAEVHRDEDTSLASAPAAVNAGSPRESTTTRQAAADRACNECGTRIEIAVETDVMIVTAYGDTCETCAPEAETRAAHTETVPRITNTVRVWWAPRADGPGQWRVACEPLIDQDVRLPSSPRPDVADVPEPTPDSVTTAEKQQPNPYSLAVDKGWKAALLPDFIEIFGRQDWPVIDPVWQPDDCRILGAFAVLLRMFWLETVAGSDGSARMVVRLTSLPPVVAALVPEVALRWMNSEQPTALPVSGMVAVFRTLGPLLCAATGHATECVELERLLDGAPGLPTPDALDKLPIAPVRSALTARSGLPPIADLFVWELILTLMPYRAEQNASRNRLRPVPHETSAAAVAFFRPAAPEAPATTGEPAPDAAGVFQPFTSPVLNDSTRRSGVPDRQGPAAAGAYDRPRAPAADGPAAGGGESAGAGSRVRRERRSNTIIPKEAGSGAGRASRGRGTVSPGLLSTAQALKTGSAPNAAFTFGHA